MLEKIINILTLSLVIGIILTICLLLKGRFATNYDDILRESLKGVELGKKYVILYALLIFPATVYIIINLNKEMVLYFYFLVGVLILGPVGYILIKNKAMVLLGLIYPVLYFNYWNIYTFNLIAILFVVSIILLMSKLVPWKISKLFVILILVMDIILVFITKDMVVLGSKIMSLQIPILIFIPFAGGIILGLGDIFIFGLLCLQYTKEKGYLNNKSLAFIWITTALLFVILYIINAYFPKQTYPATIFVALSFIVSTILSKPAIYRIT